MEKLISRIIIFIPLFIITLSAYAENINDFDEKLIELNNLEDKAYAIKKLQTIIDKNKITKRQETLALIAQGETYLSINKFDESIATLLKARKLAVAFKLNQKQSDINKLLGINYYYKADLSTAVKYYQESLGFYDEIDDTKLSPAQLAEISIKRANLFNNLALTYTSMNNNIDALKSYQSAEPLYQKYGSKIDKIDIRFNIATLHINLRRYDIAIKILKENIKQRIEIDDKKGLAATNELIGIAYKYAGQYDLAEKHGLIAFNYFRNKKNDYRVASNSHNLAEIYQKMTNYEQSKKYAIKAVSLSEKTGNQRALAGGLQSLARIQYFEKHYEQALKTLARSNEMAIKINYLGILDYNFMLSSLVHAGQQNTTKALLSLEGYIKSRDEKGNKRLNEQLARFESEQLSQQVERLQQHEKLQQLEIDKSTQQRNFVIFGTILLLVVIFLVYRRYLETRLTHDLEKRVKQRTEALEFFMQELRHANKIKSQFLANMSHEIRTPLTAVIGQAEAIINGDIDDNYLMKEVDIIHGNSLHLLQLVNDILDISKIEANKLELELQEQDLHIIIQDLVDMFTKAAIKKGLNFSITHTLPVPFIINIDSFRLKQVLINFCSNAIKFTEQGSVNLNASFANDELVFMVTDTGIGMTKEHVSKIFDSFTQADGSISRRFGGSGLGLFLSEQLTMIMGGKISVTSVENEGSTFYFTLPCTYHHEYDSSIDLEHAIQVLPKVPQGIVEKALALYSGEIILADDHDDNRRLIARLLQGLGLDVLLASNGLEAIELYKQSQAKLILLDIQMPEMDGIEAFKQLRKIGCTQPIYALTANAMSHEIEQYLALGFNGHLKKPIERKIFINTIDKYYQANDINIANIDTQSIFNNIDMSDLVKQFKENLSQDKDAIQRHHSNSDMEALAKSAHRLAGAAQMFGFSELSNSAIQLELIIKDKQDSLSDILVLEEINLHTQQTIDNIDDVQNNHSL